MTDTKARTNWTAVPPGAPAGEAGPRRTRHQRHHSAAFWVVAAAFCVNLAFSAVPTPLYVIYQRRDHFSTLMITVVYAVYAIGVIGSLFLGGHISDWVGRRRVLVPALAINAASAVLFIAFPSLAGLIIARVVSGISIGLTTGTATAYLAELHLGAGGPPTGRRPQVVATAANLGGVGVGPLGAGLLAQFVPSPLVIPYVIFGGVLFVLALLITLAPETASRPDPLPAWRPQRVAIPAHARGTFLAATGAAAAALAVYGVFNSLMPGFLAGTMHQTSFAVAGAVAFSAFAAGAVAQIAMGTASTATTLKVAVPVLFAGLTLFTTGIWLPSLPVFVIGGVVTGAGGGLVFRGSLVAAASTAPSGSRAEVLAGFFLGGYVGLSVPVIALGIATEYFTARDVMLIFVVLAAIAIAAGTQAALHHLGDQHSPERADQPGHRARPAGQATRSPDN
jgi:MFS family permease